MRFTLPCSNEKKKGREFGQRRILKTISVPNLPDLIGTAGGEKGLLPFGEKRGQSHPAEASRA